MACGRCGCGEEEPEERIRKERQVQHGAEGKGWDSQPVSARGTVGMSYRGLLTYLAWKEMSLCFGVHISIILGVK